MSPWKLAWRGMGPWRWLWLLVLLVCLALVPLEVAR